MAETHWYWDRLRNQSHGYWRTADNSIHVGPIPLTEDGRPHFVPREDLEEASEQIAVLRDNETDFETREAQHIQQIQTLEARLEAANERERAALQAVGRVQGKHEQDFENDQVRQMHRTGRCPVCGADVD